MDEYMTHDVMKKKYEDFIAINGPIETRDLYEKLYYELQLFMCENSCSVLINLYPKNESFTNMLKKFRYVDNEIKKTLLKKLKNSKSLKDRAMLFHFKAPDAFDFEAFGIIIDMFNEDKEANFSTFSHDNYAYHILRLCEEIINTYHSSIQEERDLHIKSYNTELMRDILGKIKDENIRESVLYYMEECFDESEYEFNLQHEKMILECEVEELKKLNKKLKKKNKELETHIKYMPEGTGYEEAKESFGKKIDL